ncbi:MAG: hypothetical protein FD180_4904 [Planctomycetota bacterium]|nr:MAG: hypothetical protein FD180_4904 [Planctomycetota bacterium]
MRHLTVRNLAPDLAKALEREKKRGGRSLNSTIQTLLRRALGLEHGKKFSNGLAKYAGGWSEAEFQEFERNTAFLRQVDEDMWK